MTITSKGKPKPERALRIRFDTFRKSLTSFSRMRRSMSLSRVIVPVAAEPNTIMRSGCVIFRMRITISRANESSRRGRARSLSMRFMSVILVLQEASRQAVAFLHCLLDESGQRVGEAQKIGAAFLFGF